MRSLIIASTCLLALGASGLRTAKQIPGDSSALRVRDSSGSPDDTVCIKWEPYTSWDSLNGVKDIAAVTQTWVVGSAYDPCHSCEVWGDVLPCFATDSNVNLFGHRDYNKDWITRDYCRINIPGHSQAYFSHNMMLPKAGPKSQSLKWMTMKLGDQVPDNVVKYGNIVLAQTTTVPQGCCTGNGFSGYAEITPNGTLTSVHIAVYTAGFKLDTFNVAVCTDYHPVTPVPTPAPTAVPPTPMPTPVPPPTFPPTPVPPPPTPPPTPAPTPAPNADWNIITRQFCLIGCASGGYNCTTYMHLDGVCENELNGNSVQYNCSNGELSIYTYEGTGCTGSPAHSEQQRADSCVQTPSYQYIYNKCMQVKPPQSAGREVSKTQCVEGCDYECTKHDNGPAGTCQMEEPVYGSRGPTEYQCFDEFIARTHYFAPSCSEVSSDSLTVTTVVPRNKCIPTNHNTAYETYKCDLQGDAERKKI